MIYEIEAKSNKRNGRRKGAVIKVAKISRGVSA
jgi:hypothetical protein